MAQLDGKPERYTIKIAKIRKEEVIYRSQGENGKDALYVGEGWDQFGQYWRYYFIRRTLNEAGTFDLPNYGFLRVKSRKQRGEAVLNSSSLLTPK